MAVHHFAAHAPSQRTVNHLEKKLENMEAKEDRRVAAERTFLRRFVDVALNNGGAFGMGVLHGRKGGMPETAGIPWDAGFGFLTTGLGLFAGKWLKGAADPIIALGSGMLSYWSGSMGAQLGQSMRKNAGEFTGVAFTDDQAKTAGVQVRTVVAGPVAGAPAFGAPMPYVPPYYAPPYAQSVAPQQQMWNFAHYGMTG
jgi:hypothetical protein